jgi:alpha-glucosidase
VTDQPWWHDMVLYQIYPRSFQDSNGDGIGDLPGIVQRLDHLRRLGVDAIWLSPTFPSPNHDWGYDVADYRGIHPDLGTLADMDQLIVEARSREISVLLDLVPNHTSDEHPWFRDALSSRAALYRDWYVWADPRPDGSPPNNWLDVTGLSAWTLDTDTGQYYLHNFLPNQPDLNWWNPEVRDEFDGILRYWYDRGIAGFRIDVAHALIKDRLLRDDPLPPPGSQIGGRQIQRVRQYSMNRPEAAEIHQRWRRLSDAYDPPRVLVGETVTNDVEQWARFYGPEGQGLSLSFDFPFLFSRFEAGPLGRVIDESLLALPAGAAGCWFASNHDNSRFPTRWAEGDDRRARLGLLLLLTLPGVVTLYYGDELAMPDVPVPGDRVRDGFVVPGGSHPGRDPERTPMRWDATPGAGFTAGGVEPWLPLGGSTPNVAAQWDDPGSPLHLVRDLLAFRREHPEVRASGTREVRVDEEAGTLTIHHAGGTVIACNFSDAPRTVVRMAGRIAISSTREREGEAIEHALELSPHEGAVVVAP